MINCLKCLAFKALNPSVSGKFVSVEQPYISMRCTVLFININNLQYGHSCVVCMYTLE